jgi:hypothetical protein
MSRRMVCTMAFLYSKPPSSLSTFDRKFMRARYFWGNFRHRERMASTTTILKSSAHPNVGVADYEWDAGSRVCEGTVLQRFSFFDSEWPALPYS